MHREHGQEFGNLLQVLRIIIGQTALLCIQLLMEPALKDEVKSAVELSLKGDPKSVAAADTLLGTTLPSKPGYLPTLFTIAVDTQVCLNNKD